MSAITEALVLGIYVPAAIFSGVACWLLFWRLLLPALRERRLTVEAYAIALSAVFALAELFGVNIYYGTARWLHQFGPANTLPMLAVFKVLGLAASIFATAALSRAATDAPHLARLCGIALSLWMLGAVAAWLFV